MEAIDSGLDLIGAVRFPSSGSGWIGRSGWQRCVAGGGVHGGDSPEFAQTAVRGLDRVTPHALVTLN